MTATVVSVTRRTLGLVHEVWVVRCPNCRTKSEVRDPHIAVSISRNHQCPTGAQP